MGFRLFIPFWIVMSILYNSIIYYNYQKNNPDNKPKYYNSIIEIYLLIWLYITFYLVLIVNLVSIFIENFKTNHRIVTTQTIKNNENNKLLNENTKLNNGSINVKLPIIGFGTELNNDIKKIIENIMEEEKITFRDFIIRAMPDLSLEGDERNTLIRVNDFKIISKEKDELNENKEKITVKFSLPKGSFATVLIDYLFS